MPGAGEASPYGSATNAPQFRTTVTCPSAASTRTARAAVVRLTLYCAPSWLAEGSCSPGSHSPASNLARRASAMARYGTCGVLGTPQHPPPTILALQGCQGRLSRKLCTRCQGCPRVLTEGGPGR